MKKFLLLFCVNGAAAVILVFLLSPGFFNVFERPFFQMLIGLVIGFASAIGALTLDYRMLFVKQKTLAQIKIREDAEDKPQRYIQLLRQCLNKVLFKKDLEAGIDQIERFEKKQRTIRLLLETATEGNRKKCGMILDQVEDIFYNNVKSLATRAIIFDEDEYQLYREGRLELATETARAQKGELYQSLVRYVDEITNRNEEIILQLDELALELTRASTASEWDANTILTMKKLDEYIGHTKQTQDLDREVGEEVWRKLKM